MPECHKTYSIGILICLYVLSFYLFNNIQLTAFKLVNKKYILYIHIFYNLFDRLAPEVSFAVEL